jgi:RimJ/RimL family protein N-acetyltransferase
VVASSARLRLAARRLRRLASDVTRPTRSAEDPAVLDTPTVQLPERRSLREALRTERLWLRRWCDSDRAAFAELNADPAVREFFPSLLTRAQSDAEADRIEAHFARHGFGLWAVERVERPGFIGMVGLASVERGLAPAPATEIGWRLARSHWGCGYASEAASAGLRHAFDALGLAQVVSFTSAGNLRSRAVMERIGMQRDPTGDFDHPRVPEGPLRRHVLYRLCGDTWRTRPGPMRSPGTPA